MRKDQLKIVCICNMNNNMFCLTRYLRDMGYDAELIMFMDGAAHFLPEADVFDEEYKKYSKTVFWERIKDQKERDRTIKEDLKKYNFFIGCGLVPAFLNYVGIKLDIFIPYGADIYESPFYHIKSGYKTQKIKSTLLLKFSSLVYKLPSEKNKSLRTSLTKAENFLQTYHYSEPQLEGIRNSKFIIQCATNDTFEKDFKLIEARGKRINVALPFLYTPLYNPETIKHYYSRSVNYKDYLKIRNENDLVIFHHARHQWKTSPDIFTWKANDKLIKGFAKFVRAYPQCKAKLVMTEYGDDVAESKKLVAELGIDGNVSWFKLMPRKEIMVALDIFDLGCGEFANSWIIAGVILETLCMAKPLLHYMEKENYKKDYPEVYPYLHVANENDAFKRIEEYYKEPERYKKEAIKGKEWFQKHGIDIPLGKIVEVIEAA